MDKKKNIDQLIEEALNSADDIRRASPKPYLLTRVHGRLNQTKDSLWERAFRYVGRPAFAIPALSALLLVNVSVIAFNKVGPFAQKTDQAIQIPADDFAYSVASIYDIENTEP